MSVEWPYVGSVCIDPAGGCVRVAAVEDFAGDHPSSLGAHFVVIQPLDVNGREVGALLRVRRASFLHFYYPVLT